MTRGPRVVVTAVGVCSPLGRSARLFALGLRAGLTSLKSMAVGARRVRVAPAAKVDDGASLDERLAAVAAPALAEVTARLASPVPLICAVPALPTNAPPELSLDPAAALSLARRQSGAEVDLSRTTFVAGANTATIAAFARALDALGAERGLDAILVGAMDSWLVEPRLSALLEQKLARAEGELARSRRGALVPSEAAVFVLLERERTAHAAGRRALAAIVTSELTRRAEKDAAAPLLAAMLGKLAAGTPRAWLINDVNGESRRADTWAAAARDARDASGSIRMATILEEVSSPARDVGDAGAATGALGVALAATLFGAGAGPEEAAIIGVYDAGAVGGLLLERAGEPDRSAAQPAAPSSAGSSELALTFRVLESALRSFRAVEHRLHPARRSPILDATFALGTRLAALEDEEFPAVDLFDAVDLTCRELGVACERANRSEERRGRAAEPTVKDLERLGREIAEVVRELRVSSPEPPEEVTTPPPGPVPTLVSRGVPFELPIPFTAIPRAPKASAPEQEVDFEDELEGGARVIPGGRRAPAAARPARAEGAARRDRRRVPRLHRAPLAAPHPAVGRQVDPRPEGRRGAPAHAARPPLRAVGALRHQASAPALAGRGARSVAARPAQRELDGAGPDLRGHARARVRQGPAARAGSGLGRARRERGSLRGLRRCPRARGLAARGRRRGRAVPGGRRAHRVARPRRRLAQARGHGWAGADVPLPRVSSHPAEGCARARSEPAR
ncbi:MAG: hypothetical protein IPM79_37050 [Polyangiaceae bacterium]|nr:hypothetical protein [Polyangiaceae bacterium]